jgi:hypothetical protein
MNLNREILAMPNAVIWSVNGRRRRSLPFQTLLELFDVSDERRQCLTDCIWQATMIQIRGIWQAQLAAHDNLTRYPYNY